MTCNSAQALKIFKLRAIESINTIVGCLPSGSNVSAYTVLINSCTTLEAAQSVLDLVIARAICYLNSQSTGNVSNLGQDFVFPELIHGLDNLYIYNAFAGSFTLPLLEDAQRGLYFSYSDTNGDGGNMSFLRFVSVPVLTFVQDFFFVGRCPLCTTINAPLLAHVGSDVNISSNTRLTSVNFDSLAFLGRDFLASGSLLAGLRLPAWSSWGGTQFLCDSNGIPTADVNALLIQMASFLPYTGRTINFSGGGNGPPSGAGLVAKAAIIAATNTVTTN